MKILVTGAKGMLGRTLVEHITTHTVVGTDLPEADITDPENIRKVIQAESPDAVIHCAAMTAVDKCESEPENAFAINAKGTENVAKACDSVGAWLLAISTDYVFSGDLDRPYVETDATNPKSVYGKSKLEAEKAVRKYCNKHTIARIAWLYGPGGPSFLHTMLKLARDRDEIKVVADQIGNPTSTLAVAAGIDSILDYGLRGTVHSTCEGEASWYEFTKEIFRLAGMDCRVQPCSSDEFPRPAPRPRNSRLENRALADAGLPPLPHWREALAEFLQDE